MGRIYRGDTEVKRMSANTIWPDLTLAAWSDTCETLHLRIQIVGKVRIALTPLMNHWWNATIAFISERLLPSIEIARRPLSRTEANVLVYYAELVAHGLVEHSCFGVT